MIEPQAERLGCSLDGLELWVGVTRARALDTAGFGVELLCEFEMPLLPLQIVAGKLGHALQANRALWSYLKVFYQAADETRGGPMRYLSGAARRELLGVLMFTPVMGTSLAGEIDSVVTASDATEKGLGVSRSVGLTQRGQLMTAAYSEGGDERALSLRHGLSIRAASLSSWLPPSMASLVFGGASSACGCGWSSTSQWRSTQSCEGLHASGGQTS